MWPYAKPELHGAKGLNEDQDGEEDGVALIFITENDLHFIHVGTCPASLGFWRKKIQVSRKKIITYSVVCSKQNYRIRTNKINKQN